MTLFATGVAVTVEKAMSGSFPSPRIYIALAVVYIVLGFMADFAPQVAGPLAVLVFIAVLLSNGGKAFEGVASIAAREVRKSRFRAIDGGKPATVSDRVNAQEARKNRRNNR